MIELIVTPHLVTSNRIGNLYRIGTIMKIKMTCNINSTLRDVLKIISKNGKGIAFIIDDSTKLYGILTDGDIRKLLLKEYKLDSPIKSIINRDFVYAKIDEDPSKVIQGTSDEIRIIPIISKDFKYVDFYELNASFRIPVVDLEFLGNEFKYLAEAFLSTWISSSGKYIEKFERSFAKFIGRKYAVAVTNCTAALHLSLLAIGIKPGDEVIVPDLTFAATINAVLYVGATPVIVDIEKNSWCIDPEEIKKAITPSTKAIIPVHIYGQPCNMTEIMKIARAHKLFVVEDSAEAHGAMFGKKKVGSFGDISCFSFYANKVITTGEGGMCLTNSKSLADKIRVLKDHGMSKKKKYWHSSVGYNYRMTNLQAAIGTAQMERIEEIIKGRSEIEEKYKTELAGIDTIEFQMNNLPDRKKITWLVSLLVNPKKRDKILKKLKAMGIDTRPFFHCLSKMPVYEKYTFSNKNSDNVSRRGINLPTISNLNSQVFSIIREVIIKYG